MSLADQVANQESEITGLKAERDALKAQVERQKGGILEGRAQNEQLIKRNEQLAAQNARYDKHFRDALASSESIIKHRKELEPELHGVRAEAPPATLKSRLAKRLTKNGGDAA